MNSLKEEPRMQHLDPVVLRRDVPEYGLKKGDVGAVVHCYPDRATVEVEFVTAGGRTVAVLTLTRGDVRPLESAEILHVRAPA
jgi:hypothetical protein